LGKIMTIFACGLTKIYNDRTVVNDVTFEVHPGEVVGLLGPNGAGKTTTFYMLVGLVKPDNGRILLNKKDLTYVPMHKRAKAGIGYLPQETSIFRKLTVEENIMLVLEMNKKLNDKQRKEKLDALLEDFGLTKLRNNASVQLSGGERRRVEISRALAADPKFILLDEPFTGIDPIAIQDIQENIKALTKRGIGILLTDHNPRATLSITDRAYIIFDGTIKVAGSSLDISNDPVAKKYYLGQDFQL
jgi:lipopolysaccharide export system ATP-binding protein